MAEARKPQETPQESSALASLGLALSDWFERWFPDAFALALAAAAIVAAASMLSGSSALETAQRFGAGFWDLATFTLQMSLIIVTGYAVATAPPVYAMIRRLATLPSSGRGAVAFVALFSMLASLVSWSFSLIFSGLLAREVSHRVRGADYRAVGAAAYLGVGSVWALGLSSSAALIMASPASLPDPIEKISGVIPLGQTLGLWQSAVIAATLILASMAIAYFSAPPPSQARSMADMGVTYAPAVRDTDHPADARRVARIQPAAHDHRVRPRLRVSGTRGRHRRAEHRARSQPLPLPVPDGGAAAALAAAIVRAGDHGVGDAGRRRADSVPDLRGHRPGDDRRRPGHARWRTSSSRSRRSTPIR